MSQGNNSSWIKAHNCGPSHRDSFSHRSPLRENRDNQSPVKDNFNNRSPVRENLDNQSPSKGSPPKGYLTLRKCLSNESNIGNLSPKYLSRDFIQDTSENPLTSSSVSIDFFFNLHQDWNSIKDGQLIKRRTEQLIISPELWKLLKVPGCELVTQEKKIPSPRATSPTLINMICGSDRKGSFPGKGAIAPLSSEPSERSLRNSKGVINFDGSKRGEKGHNLKKSSRINKSHSSLELSLDYYLNYNLRELSKFDVTRFILTDLLSKYIFVKGEERLQELITYYRKFDQISTLNTPFLIQTIIAYFQIQRWNHLTIWKIIMKIMTLEQDLPELTKSLAKCLLSSILDNLILDDESIKENFAILPGYEFLSSLIESEDWPFTKPYHTPVDRLLGRYLPKLSERHRLLYFLSQDSYELIDLKMFGIPNLEPKLNFQTDYSKISDLLLDGFYKLWFSLLDYDRSQEIEAKTLATSLIEYFLLNDVQLLLRIIGFHETDPISDPLDKGPNIKEIPFNNKEIYFVVRKLLLSFDTKVVSTQLLIPLWNSSHYNQYIIHALYRFVALENHLTTRLDNDISKWLSSSILRRIITYKSNFFFDKILRDRKDTLLIRLLQGHEILSDVMADVIYQREMSQTDKDHPIINILEACLGFENEILKKHLPAIDNFLSTYLLHNWVGQHPTDFFSCFKDPDKLKYINFYEEIYMSEPNYEDNYKTFVFNYFNQHGVDMALKAIEYASLASIKKTEKASLFRGKGWENDLTQKYVDYYLSEYTCEIRKIAAKVRGRFYRTLYRPHTELILDHPVRIEHFRKYFKEFLKQLLSLEVPQICQKLLSVRRRCLEHSGIDNPLKYVSPLQFLRIINPNLQKDLFLNSSDISSPQISPRNVSPTDVNCSKRFLIKDEYPGLHQLIYETIQVLQRLSGGKGGILIKTSGQLDLQLDDLIPYIESYIDYNSSLPWEIDK